MTAPPCPLCDGTRRVAGLRCRLCARRRRRAVTGWALIILGCAALLFAVIGCQAL